jgi:hypothetical protein
MSSSSQKSILEKSLTKDECLKWQKDKTKNPRTNRLIERNGLLYNKIEEQCKIFLEKKKEKSPEITKEEIKSTNIQSRITIHDFIKELKKYKTAKEAIEKIFKDDKNADDIITKLNEKDKENTKSRQGFIYELLWDICIKFNITNFTNKYTEHGIGNFNIFSNFVKIDDYINDYLKQGYISGNSGGYSDITFKTKNDDDKYDLSLVSVKYRKSDDIKNYDIQKLCTLIDDRKNDNYNSINTLLFVKNKEHFKKICKSANQSSNILIKYISPNGNYENVYDLNDLETHYSKLWKILDDFDFIKDVDNFKENYLQIYKKKFIPRFHQELFIEKITSLIKKEQKKLLVGAIPRSGKTYIMAGTILKDVEDTGDSNKKSKTKFNNYLIITPAPNETLEQYYRAFDDYYDFKNNNIIPINVKDEKIEFKGEDGKHNVFLISKQRLGFRDRQDNDKEDIEIYNDKYIENIKTNIIKYFGDNKFKIIFFDEAHFGMSTKIAQDIFSELDKKNESYKIYVTATYNKPKQIYNIEDKNIIKWDLHDIRLIKNIDDKSYYKTLEYFKEKFGTKIFNKVVKNQKNTIVEQYNHFPEPILITSVWDKDFVDNEIKKIGSNETFGFDMHKLFMPQSSNTFKNQPQLIQFLEYYFGYIDDKNYIEKENFYENKNEYEKRGILPNIQKICLNNCRTLQYPNHKTTQLWFLPPYEISKITNSLIELLKNKFTNIFNNYIFYVAVEGVNGKKKYDNVEYLQKPEKIKKEIENLEKNLYTNAKYSKYEGLIILAGNRLQLGISLNNVDIVALFTNITASDAIYQMIFRSMTEIEDDIECDGKSYCGRKKYGFMVDLNPQRTLFTIDYLTDMYLDNDRFKYENREKKQEIIADLINIDKHKFIDRYKRENKEGYINYVKEFFNKLYKAWDAKTENIQRLLLDKNLFDKNIFKPGYDIKELFTEIEKEKKQQKHKIDKPDNEVQKGNIKKTIYDIIKPEKGKKNPNSYELWAYLFAEIISILSLITSYTDKDGNACIFNLENKDNFLYELKQIIENVIDKDDDIKNILLYTLKKRIIIKDSIEDNQLYNMINNAIDNMEEKQRGGNLLELNKQIQLRKSQIYSIKEPDELLKYINDNLKPKQVEKGERGEVFTPMTLVNEMLDTLNELPEKVWKNPNLKWLDPAAGMGNFPVAVYMRLMEGLKDVKGYRDEEERRKHILENMLYMVELDKTNVFMMKKIFCGKKYKLNIFEGSFIDGKYKKEIDIFNSINDDEKKKINKKENIKFLNKIKEFNNNFDIILGNPPFNSGGVSKGGGVIWKDFVFKSFDMLINNGYLLIIHPQGWRKSTSKKASAGDIWNLFKNYNLQKLKIISFPEKIPNFPDVDYYLLNKNKVKKKTLILNDNKYYDLYNLPFIPHLINKESISIINKVLNKNGEKFNIIYDQAVKPKKGIKNISGIPHYHYYDVDKNLYQEVFHKYKDKPGYLNNPKIIMTYKSGKQKANLYAKYISKEIGTTNNTMYQIIKHQDNKSNLIKFLNSKLINFILKITQYSAPPNYINEFNILNLFSKPNEGNIQNQEDIYHLFKLTKQEIELIENNTKDFKEIKGGFKSKKHKSKKLSKRNKSI